MITFLKGLIVQLLDAMPKFTFKRFYRTSNGEIDDENVWISTRDKFDAICGIKAEYPKSVDFILLSSE